MERFGLNSNDVARLLEPAEDPEAKANEDAKWEQLDTAVTDLLNLRAMIGRRWLLDWAGRDSDKGTDQEYSESLARNNISEPHSAEEARAIINEIMEQKDALERQYRGI